jgi:hypothetical protein
MEIKGSAVKTIPDFLKKHHPEKFSAWLDALPEKSRLIFSEPVMSTDWYPLHEAGLIPTETLGQVIFSDAFKGAWQCGRYSAESALTGVYKVFIKVASPFFIIDRAGRIFSTYYQPSSMEVVQKGDNFVKLHITRFEEPSALIEGRIGGWIERAMEIHGVGSVSVTIEKSMAHGDPITEILVKWGDS